MRKIFQKFFQQRETDLRKQIFFAYLEYLKGNAHKPFRVSGILDDVDKIIIFINTGEFKP